MPRLSKKSAAEPAAAPAGITVSKVQKKPQTAAKKATVNVPNKIFVGKRANLLLNRNGVSSASKDARRFLDSVLVVFMKDLVESAFILKDALEEKTLLPRHVLLALKHHTNMDMLNYSVKTSKKPKKVEAEPDFED